MGCFSTAPKKVHNSNIQDDPDKQDDTNHTQQLKPPQSDKQARNSELTSLDNMNKYYKIIKVLGHGSYGTVRLAEYKITNDNGDKQFAIKTVSKEHTKGKEEYLERELEIMKTIDHPNIIQFYEIYQDTKYIHYVMEYCSGGDLFTLLLQKKYFKEDFTARIMYKLVSAVAHIHTKNIIHRDLKMDNVLFLNKSHGYKDAEPKIIDFGLSTFVYERPGSLVVKQQPLKQSISQKKRRLSYVGTPLYVAPEVINHEKYDNKVDSWSLGVIMFALLCGQMPFVGEDKDDVYQRIIDHDYEFKSPIWDNVSNLAKDLIANLLILNPKDRLSCQDALNHRWFHDFYLTENKQKYEKKIKNATPALVNLFNFECKNRLKKEALQLLVNHELSKEDLKHLNLEFKVLDQDRNGEIGLNDVLVVLQKQGIKVTQNQLFDMFKQVHEQDSSRKSLDLKINYKEFLQSAIDLKSYLNIERLWSLFNQFDIEKTGYITVQNVQNTANREGREIEKETLELLESEIHEKMDFQQFCQLMNPNINFEQDYQKSMTIQKG